ncbi:MAG TPA: polymer-forming cytoskeletal protein [Polyangia bacterium]|jgi:Integral membrane protein CcmA involved in cell shape determination|nr:polymer-forming cytoskeletal protein [Polyangia bacterium]
MADKETVIGPDTRISGEVRGDEDLVVRGRIDGRVQLTQNLTVEKGATVQADVDVRQLVVSGTVVGAIVASESVKLMSTARVVGDLASPRVMMEAGAAYRGRVDMGDIAGARAAVGSRAAQRPAAGEKAAIRPAPPRMAMPGKAVVASKAAAPVVPAARLTTPAAAGATAPASPPAFPRVAGAMGGMAPAWAKKKIRRR